MPVSHPVLRCGQCKGVTAHKMSCSWQSLHLNSATAAQALADVRTLDEWASETVDWRRWKCGALPGFGHHCWLEDTQHRTVKPFTGATPDEARAKAAAWVREQAKKGA